MTRLKSGFIALALALLPCAVHAAPQSAVNDTALGASISCQVGAATTSFVAVLPQGSSFQVLVDGNQDGKWGTAAYTGQTLPVVTPDFAYGVDTDIYFCSQYIIGWQPDDSSRVALYTNCDGRPSKGYLQVGQVDRNKRVTTTFVIPNSELFGARKDAAVTFQIWDTKQSHYYFTPSAPLVIHR